jgi:CBS domain containing-hemolysin-like protein
MHGLPLLQFVVVAMLILVNAFFVAAEFALVSVRDTRIEQMVDAGVPGALARCANCSTIWMSFCQLCSWA